MASSAVEIDASPITFNEVTDKPEHILDIFMNKLTVADYRSIFFLLIDVKISKKDFLFLVKKEIHILKNKFRNVYYEFRFKEALLIEVFGTLQKYDMLRLLGTCSHVFEKDKNTFTQLASLWKFLFTVCEQLEDGEVDYLKEKLFPELVNLNICCAEQLFCLAFSEGKLEKSNWKSKLSELLKSSHPECSKLITLYKGSNLKYYPLRRPTKTSPCGIAIIMNHVNFDASFPSRPESNSDASALQKLWQSFGFKTEIYTDLTAEEVKEVFRKLSKRNHSNYDVFVACYLSHGDEGVVVARDGERIELTYLVDLIANHCETLVGKPKLFFVQACQGQGIQTGFGRPILTTSDTQSVEVTRHSQDVALLSDVLLFNSSIKGFVSVRDVNGSWFINALVSEMEENGEELNVAMVLTKVQENVTSKKGDLKLRNQNVADIKQTPVIHNTLKYELKLKRVL